MLFERFNLQVTCGLFIWVYLYVLEELSVHTSVLCFL